eukprot:c33543_g1_i1.p1 GENE.c33543_g1_i1~~c33543_g1_i1.p1  ORF type:complete len:195 (+),score=17.01 c33543_g1_i1:75-587(+)
MSALTCERQRNTHSLSVYSRGLRCSGAFRQHGITCEPLQTSQAEAPSDEEDDLNISLHAESHLLGSLMDDDDDEFGLVPTKVRTFNHFGTQPRFLADPHFSTPLICSTPLIQDLHRSTHSHFASKPTHQLPWQIPKLIVTQYEGDEPQLPPPKPPRPQFITHNLTNSRRE